MKLEPKDLLSLEEYDSKRDSIKKELIIPVSYTHLTLPTIYSV